MSALDLRGYLRAEEQGLLCIEPLNLGYNLTRDAGREHAHRGVRVGAGEQGTRHLGTEILCGRREGDSVEGEAVLGRSLDHRGSCGNLGGEAESGILTGNHRAG